MTEIPYPERGGRAASPEQTDPGPDITARPDTPGAAHGRPSESHPWVGDKTLALCGVAGICVCSALVLTAGGALYLWASGLPMAWWGLVLVFLGSLAAALFMAACLLVEDVSG